MRAVIQERYGSPDDLVVREVAEPEVGDAEVLVRVRAASLHPDVWHVVTGRPAILRLMGAGLLRPRNPIPGTDMAGVVERVGTAVTTFRPGDAVFGETIASQQWTNGGAFAEYVAVRAEWLAPKPEEVSFEQAASVPSSGFIAWLNLRDVGRLQPGRKVLVNGAGGGVGSLAVQIVKSHGAHVTAVDRAGKLEMLRSLGADEVVDCEREDFTLRGLRYDLVFDIPGTRPLSELRRALEPDGRYVPIGHEGFGASGRRLFGLIPHFLRLMLLSRFVRPLQSSGVPPPGRKETLAGLRDLLAAGRITPVIDSAYPLDAVREAFRRMIGGESRGKVVLTG